MHDSKLKYFSLNFLHTGVHKLVTLYACSINLYCIEYVVWQILCKSLKRIVLLGKDIDRFIKSFSVAYIF